MSGCRSYYQPHYSCAETNSTSIHASTSVNNTMNHNHAEIFNSFHTFALVDSRKRHIAQTSLEELEDTKLPASNINKNGRLNRHVKPKKVIMNHYNQLPM
jgi:hypothetical protein